MESEYFYRFTANAYWPWKETTPYTIGRENAKEKAVEADSEETPGGNSRVVITLIYPYQSIIQDSKVHITFT